MNSDLDFQEIAVVGGGTAGFLSALFFKKKYPDASITVIRSEEIGIIGVGEGSTTILPPFLKQLGIDLSEFYKETNSTIKLGFKYIGWTHHDFYQTFNSINLQLKDEDYFQYSFAKAGDNVRDFYSILNPYNKLAETKKLHIIDNILQKHYGFHFDAHLTAEFLEKKSIEQGITVISDNIVDALQDHTGAISSIVLKKEGIKKYSFFVDCTGFKRLLANKLGVRFLEYTDLHNDSAIPFVENEIVNDTFTTATAMNAGWLWKIPTTSRCGYGYVFSSKFLSDEKALQEVSTVLNKSITPRKIIKFKPGKLENILYKNVLFNGLCSHFVDPLHSTSIKNTVLILEEFDKNLPITQFNFNVMNIIDYAKQSISVAYLGPGKQNEYWKSANSLTLNSDFFKDFISNIKSGNISHPKLYDYKEAFTVSNFTGFFTNYNIVNSIDFQKELNQEKICNFLNIKRHIYKNSLSNTTEFTFK